MFCATNLISALVESIRIHAVEERPEGFIVSRRARGGGEAEDTGSKT